MASCFLTFRTIVFLLIFVPNYIVMDNVVYSSSNFDYWIQQRFKRSIESHRGTSKPSKAEIPSKTSSQVPDRTNIFVTSNSTVVTAQIGGTATLPCVVRKFNQGVVSWIRKVDYHLLTVGLTTYTGDDRYLVEHVRHLQNWGLQIKNIQEKDAGLYECQVSTHPPISIFIQLNVVEASSEIIGAPDLHIKSGSTLQLTCRLRDSTEQPTYVFWYHEKRMINYDGAERGVSVKKNKASSVLEIKDIDKTDDGNYTCVPSNARPASINVHVLNATAEEKPAAMQDANSPTSHSEKCKVCLPYEMALLLFMIFINVQLMT